MSTPEHTADLMIGGTLRTVSGAHLFRVIATTDDGQREEMTIAADDEIKAHTRLMAATTMVLRGQSVTYDVTRLA